MESKNIVNTKLKLFSYPLKNENIGKPTIGPIDKYNTGMKNIKEYFILIQQNLLMFI